MEKLSKKELDEYLGKEEAQDYYKDLEKFNQDKFVWFSFDWRAWFLTPLWSIKNRAWGLYIVGYFLMIFVVFYVPLCNESMFTFGSLLYANIFWLSLITLTVVMMLSMNVELLGSITREVRQGVTKQANPSKVVLWGWSLFFYLPLILSLSFKASAFISELIKPFDQKSHDAFEKALSELERPNPLQVLATGYINNGKHEKPKPKGFEEYLGIDFEEEVDAFKEKMEALKNQGYDQYMQKGVKRQFIDNKDGTITDNSLGLMWQDTKWVAKALYKVDEIEEVCKRRKTIGGYEDWRVPTAYELKSLMNFNEDKINDNVFKYGYDVKYHGFWSSTTSKYKEDNGRFIFSFTNDIGYGAGSEEHTNIREAYIRCVRTLKKQKPLRRFDFIEDVNRQVILDKGTSLMWQNEPYSYVAAKADYRDNRKYRIEIDKRMKQVDALAYCKELELGGYDDWYLPNINQIMEIGQEDGRYEFIVKERAFTKLPAVWDTESYYPYIHNSTGYTDQIKFVRCVRDAKV